MKPLLLLSLFFTIITSSPAKTNNASTDPIIGSWKYSMQSSKNDFQQVLNACSKDYSTEFFVFGAHNKFSHQFVNDKGIVVKTLTGKWKTSGDKLNVEYTDINYNMHVEYFFLDKDLVLGQNFNHVIFTKGINTIAKDLAETTISGNTIIL